MRDHNLSFVEGVRLKIVFHPSSADSALMWQPGRRRPRRAPPWPTAAPVIKHKRRQKRLHVHARSPSIAEAELTQAALRRLGRREANLHGGRRRPTTTVDTVLRSRCVHRHRFYARHWNEQPRRCRRGRHGSRQRRPEDVVNDAQKTSLPWPTTC